MYIFISFIVVSPISHQAKYSRHLNKGVVVVVVVVVVVTCCCTKFETGQRFSPMQTGQQPQS